MCDGGLPIGEGWDGLRIRGLIVKMVIKKKIGSIKGVDINSRVIDYLELEWHETSKKILHKRTSQGKEIILKLLSQTQGLTDGDVLFEEEQGLIVVSIKACEAIVINPTSMYEMAYVCYEIGNKHLPLFYENEELLVPYEAPLFKLLQASGLTMAKEERRLINQLKTSVLPHGDAGNGKSLFSKILHLTSSNE